MLEHRFKDNIIYSQLVGSISRTTLNFNFHEVKQADKTGSESSKCECTLKKTYGLPRACLISKKMKLEKPICMDEVCIHWKVLCFYDDGVTKDDKSNIFIMTEWKMIQERFMKVDDIIKLHIKEQLRKIACLEITYLKPYSKLVKIKGAPKKVKLIQSDNSTRWSPSYFEYVDSHFSDSPTPKSQKSVFKGARISKPSPPPSLPKIKFIEEMSFFMYKYIKRIVNVESDNNYDF